MVDERSVEDARGEADTDRLVHVGPTAELERAGREVVTSGNREIAVFHTDGEYVALLNRCVHQGAPICRGRLTGTLFESTEEGLFYDRAGEILVCPAHGWEFDVFTGEHLGRPDDYKIPTFDVVVRDGEVYLDLA